MNFDTTKYKVWTWKSPMILHWIINPGLAFNELILGQRVPKITLIDKAARKTLPERSFVPCPHCHTLHSSLKWTPQNNTAFKNWFGLYCDNCGKIIPCVRNLTSLVLLAVTSPIWYWFKNKRKDKWLKVQKEKFSKPLVLTQPDFKWWYVGLQFSFFMFVFMSLFDFLILQEEFSWMRLLLTAIIWILGGLVLGVFLKKSAGNKIIKQNDREKQQAT